MTKLPDGYRTTAQVAKLFNCKPRTIRRWCEKGLLVTERFNNQIIIILHDDKIKDVKVPKRGRPKGGP